jgi:hypothetical protein
MARITGKMPLIVREFPDGRQFSTPIGEIGCQKDLKPVMMKGLS